MRTLNFYTKDNNVNVIYDVDGTRYDYVSELPVHYVFKYRQKILTLHIVMSVPPIIRIEVVNSPNNEATELTSITDCIDFIGTDYKKLSPIQIVERLIKFLKGEHNAYL